jgi:hypothetical protein
MVLTAGYHVARLVAPRLHRRCLAVDLDVSHAAIGVEMAFMLVGSLTPSTSRQWAVFFVVPTLWFGWRSMTGYATAGSGAFGEPARQALACAAMLYMLLVAGASTPGLHGMGIPGMRMVDHPAPGLAGSDVGHPSIATSPALGALLLVAMIGLAAHSYLRTRRAADCCCDTALAPTLTAGCQLAMNVTTVYMLAFTL